LKAFPDADFAGDKATRISSTVFIVFSRVSQYVGGQKVKEESHCQQQKPSMFLAVR